MSQQGGQQSGSQQQQSGTQQQQSSSSSSSSVFIPAQTDPVGVVSFTEPPITATSFYKIAQGEVITFGWTFSYVEVTPTHLTVSANCDNQNTYPVGPTDGIIPGTATEVFWDVYSYQTAHPQTPLVQGTCTLSIWDDRGPSAARQPGYLAPTGGLKFALYTPQAYTAIASGWNCPGCSRGFANAVSSPLMVSLAATLVIMLLSGFHLFRRR